jgi:TorA maturation chaperone TorD
VQLRLLLHQLLLEHLSPWVLRLRRGLERHPW